MFDLTSLLFNRAYAQIATSDVAAITTANVNALGTIIKDNIGSILFVAVVVFGILLLWRITRRTIAGR